MKSIQFFSKRLFNTHHLPKKTPRYEMPDGSVLILRENPKPEAIKYNSIMTEDNLPPRIRPLNGKKCDFTENELTEARKLRQKDPGTWTIVKLSDKFNVELDMVRLRCPAPKEYSRAIRKLNDEIFENRDLAAKKRIIERIRRKATW